MEITISEIKTVNISKEQAAEISLNYIKNEFGINPQMWIENKKLMEEVEYITSHKWYSDEEVRLASKEDKILLEASKIIHRRCHGKERLSSR